MNGQARTRIRNQSAKRVARYTSKLHDERFDALRGRPVRRGLVVVSFLLLLGAVALVWRDGAAEVEAGLQILYLVVALLAVSGFTLVNIAVRAHWPEQALDERLVAVRNAAHHTAFRIVGVITGLALFAVSLAWEVEQIPFTFEPHHLRALMLAFVGLAVMLPGAVLAWREREV